MPTIVNQTRVAGVFGTSQVYTMPAVSAGNSILLSFQVVASSLPLTLVRDNTGVDLTLDYSAATANGEQTRFYYRRPNVAGAPTSITVTKTAATTTAVDIFEVNGIDNTSPLNVAITDASDVASTTTPSKAFTTTTANELVLSAWDNNNAGVTNTPQAGYTSSPDGATSSYIFMWFQADAGAAGAKTVGATISAARAYRMSVVTYKAATASSITSAFTVTFY